MGAKRGRGLGAACQISHTTPCLSDGLAHPDTLPNDQPPPDNRLILTEADLVMQRCPSPTQQSDRCQAVLQNSDKSRPTDRSVQTQTAEESGL